jgi:hypothetical protein
VGLFNVGSDKQPFGYKKERGRTCHKKGTLMYLHQVKNLGLLFSRHDSARILLKIIRI